MLFFPCAKFFYNWQEAAVGLHQRSVITVLWPEWNLAAHDASTEQNINNNLTHSETWSHGSKQNISISSLAIVKLNVLSLHCTCFNLLYKK